jgi:hypothetical protein
MHKNFHIDIKSLSDYKKRKILQNFYKNKVIFLMYHKKNYALHFVDKLY